MKHDLQARLEWSGPIKLGLDMDDTVTDAPRWFAARLRDLRSRGGRVWIISSRSDLPEVRAFTATQLRNWEIEVDGIILQPQDPAPDAPADLDWFSRSLWFKVSACRELGIDLMVDDSLSVEALFQRHGGRTMFVRYQTSDEGAP